MDGGRASRGSPKGPGPSCVPGRGWTQDKESDRKPWGSAGTQPSLPLCPLSAPGQFRDPTQAGRRRKTGTGWASEQGRKG